MQSASPAADTIAMDDQTLIDDKLEKEAYIRIFGSIPLAQRGCFIDLCAGVGKALVYAIANGFKKAKGVEIVKELVDRGNNRINASSSKIIACVTLSQGGLYNLEKAYFDEPGLVIWWGNPSPREEKRLWGWINESAVVLCGRLPKDCFVWLVARVVTGVPKTLAPGGTLYALQKKVH